MNHRHSQIEKADGRKPERITIKSGTRPGVLGGSMATGDLTMADVRSPDRAEEEGQPLEPYLVQMPQSNKTFASVSEKEGVRVLL